MKRYTTGIGDSMGLPPGGGFYYAPEVDALGAARDKRIAELEVMLGRVCDRFDRPIGIVEAVALIAEARALLGRKS